MAYERRGSKRVTLYQAEETDPKKLRMVEYDSVADALHFACRDLREGRRRPIEIAEDGVVIHDEAAIADWCRERARA